MKRMLQWMPVLLALGLLGCATRTTDSQSGAMDRLADNKNQLDQVRGQIDRTLYALDSLMRAPPAEIRDAQNRYAGNVVALRNMADELEESAKTMRARRIDYLTEWERAQLNVESPQLKRAAEQRQKEVSQRLAGVESSLRNVNQSVGPLVSEFEDIQHVTGNDPTPDGIAAVRKSGLVPAVRKRAATTNYRLDVAAARLDRALAALSPQPGTRPVRAVTTPAVPAAPAMATLPSFSQADRNASGAIEQEEAGQIQGLDFSSVDNNRDGKLSETEYEAARRSGGTNSGGTGAKTR